MRTRFESWRRSKPFQKEPRDRIRPPARRGRPRRRAGHADAVLDRQGPPSDRRAADDRPRARDGDARCSPPASPSSCGTSATRSPTPCSRPRPTRRSSTRTRSPARAGRVEQASPRSTASTATCSSLNGDVPCSTPDTLAPVLAAEHARRARPSCCPRACRTRPATAASSAAPTAAFERIVEQRDATDGRAGHRRDQRRRLPLPHGGLAARARRARRRERPGRAVPHRRRSPLSAPPGARVAAVAAAEAERRRRERPRAARRRGQRRVNDRDRAQWQLDGVTVARPADHVDRRDREPRARTSRSARAPSCKGATVIERGLSSAPTPRSSTPRWGRARA